MTASLVDMRKLLLIIGIAWAIDLFAFDARCRGAISPEPNFKGNSPATE